MRSLKANTLVLLSTALLLTCGGCDGGSGSGGSAKVGKADTPRQLLDNLAAVVSTGDKEAAKKLVDPDAPNAVEASQLLGGMVEVTHEMTELTDAVEAKFGKEAAAEIGSAGKDDNPFAKVVKMKDEAKIEESGDTATVTLPGEDPLKLIKRDGAWYLDSSDLTKEMQEGPGMELAQKMLAAMTTLAKRGQQLLTESDTAEQFNTKMEAAGEEIMGPLMGELLKAAFENADPANPGAPPGNP
jgi:hypothetical protein